MQVQFNSASFIFVKAKKPSRSTEETTSRASEANPQMIRLTQGVSETRTS